MIDRNNKIDSKSMDNVIDISLLKALHDAEWYEITEEYASDLQNIAICLLSHGISKDIDYDRTTIIEWLQNADGRDQLLPTIDGDVSDVEPFVLSVQKKSVQKRSMHSNNSAGVPSIVVSMAHIALNCRT